MSEEKPVKNGDAKDRTLDLANSVCGLRVVFPSRDLWHPEPAFPRASGRRELCKPAGITRWCQQPAGSSTALPAGRNTSFELLCPGCALDTRLRTTSPVYFPEPENRNQPHFPTRFQVSESRLGKNRARNTSTFSSRCKILHMKKTSSS